MSYEQHPWFPADDPTAQNQNQHGQASEEVDSTPDVYAVAGIPAYNEEDSIGEVVSGVRRHVDEVIVVDDGSTDRTADVAREAGGTVIEHGTNEGYGATLNTLFKTACERDARYLVTLDADGQHKARDISKLLETIRSSDADIVFGSRFEEDSESNPPLHRRFGIHVINVLTNVSLGRVRSEARLSDTQSGFRAYNCRSIESIAEDPGIGEGMGASLDIIYHAQRNEYDIAETGVTVNYHIEGTSTRNPVVHGLNLVANIVQNVLTIRVFK